MKSLLLLCFLVISSLADEESIEGKFIRLDKSNGTAVIKIENLSNRDIFVKVGDLNFPSYSIRGAGSIVGVSGGNVDLEDSRYILIRRGEKIQIEIRLRHFEEVNPKEVDVLEMDFSCQCFWLGEAQSDEVSFSVVGVVK